MMDRGNARVGVNRTRKPAPGLAKACPSLAIRVAGTEMTPREVAREVLRDAPFFSKSGGGVTFSGGEPLAHPAFVRELAQILLDRGASVAVETCLAVAPGALESVLGLPILWLADIKHVDAARFKEATGGNLSQVLANLTTLAARGARLELRIPLIPGFNADDASMEGILALAAGLPNLSGETRRIDFLPYHELALGKYAMLDRQMAWKGGHDVARHDVARWAARAAALGFTASTGG